MCAVATGRQTARQDVDPLLAAFHLVGAVTDHAHITHVGKGQCPDDIGEVIKVCFVYKCLCVCLLCVRVCLSVCMSVCVERVRVCVRACVTVCLPTCAYLCTIVCERVWVPEGVLCASRRVLWMVGALYGG